MAWYNSSWTRRKEITIDYTKVIVDETDFPLYIEITDTDLQNAQASGNDILFTDSDEVTKLEHHIIDWDSGTGTLKAFVRVPSLSSTVNTTLWIYYDNPGAANQENRTGLWDTCGYVGVWTLNEESGSSTITDHTSNGIDLTVNGTPTLDVGGALDASISFGTGDYLVSSGPHTEIDFEGADEDFTISAWVKFSGTGAYALANYLDGVGDGWDLRLNNGKTQASKDGEWNYGSSQINDSAWHRVHHKFLRSTGSGISVVHDGTGDNWASTTDAAMSLGPAADLYVGEFFDGSKSLVGNVELLQIHPSYREDDFAQTEYNNQNSPSTFHSFGTEEVGTVTETDTGSVSVTTVSLLSSATTAEADRSTTLVGSTTTPLTTTVTSAPSDATTALLSTTATPVTSTIQVIDDATAVVVGTTASSVTVSATAITDGSSTLVGSAATPIQGVLTFEDDRTTTPVASTVSTLASATTYVAAGSSTLVQATATEVVSITSDEANASSILVGGNVTSLGVTTTAVAERSGTIEQVTHSLILALPSHGLLPKATVTPIVGGRAIEGEVVSLLGVPVGARTYVDGVEPDPATVRDLLNGLPAWMNRTRGSNNYHLFSSVAKTVDRLEVDLENVREATSVREADTLDELRKLGAIVGLSPADGETLEQFRNRVIGNLQMITSEGTADDLIKNAATIMQVDPSLIKYEEPSPGVITLTVPERGVEKADLAEGTLGDLLDLQAAASYRVNVSLTGTLKYIDISTYDGMTYDTTKGYDTLSGGVPTEAGGTYSGII